MDWAQGRERNEPQDCPSDCQKRSGELHATKISVSFTMWVDEKLCTKQETHARVEDQYGEGDFTAFHVQQGEEHELTCLD
ncbi:unnamed protein product [Dovyalis caffra]|uniref:Uncharacterized protein n=1 Tax=Dovyalis caffra TaxID=77055 RepID=A0AAV1RSW3_9ROSI|nr:unnamed protein product [Dovyalis caffra]